MRLAAIGAICATVLVGGCAPMTAAPQSLGQALSNHEARINNAPSPILVSIRYPANFSERAASAFRSYYIDNPMYTLPLTSWDIYEESIDNAVVKTTFYAHDLYKYLKNHLPPGAVIIEPGVIDIVDGRYVYTGIDKELPAALNIDFLAYSNPRKNQYGPVLIQTLGQSYAPIIIGTTNIGAAKGTGGVLFTTDKIVADSSREQKGAFIINSLAIMQNGARSVSGNYPLAKEHVYILPQEGFGVSDGDWQSYISYLRRGKASPAYAGGAITKEIGNIAIESIGLIDTAEAHRGAMVIYSGVYPRTIDTADGDVFRAIEAAEARFMAARSDAIVLSYDKNIMPAVVSRISAEREHGEAFRRAATVGSMQAMIAVAGGGFGSVIGGMQAMAQMDDTFASIQDIYATSLSALNSAQTETVLSMGSQQVTVTAASLDELREKLRKAVLKAQGKP